MRCYLIEVRRAEDVPAQIYKENSVFLSYLCTAKLLHINSPQHGAPAAAIVEFL